MANARNGGRLEKKKRGKKICKNSENHSMEIDCGEKVMGAVAVGMCTRLQTASRIPLWSLRGPMGEIITWRPAEKIDLR